MTVEKFLREAEVWGYHLEGDNVMVARLIQIIRRQRETMKFVASMQCDDCDSTDMNCEHHFARLALDDCDRIAGGSDK
ncbi:MAG: hypothetical protein IPI28_19035 [Candidatus Omnitrophica bacterium]|nr:hypothetical protein [Candidatus Omnitrophota bacterium]